MECRHEHQNLKTVGDRLFCKACGQELPLEFLAKGEAEEPKAEKQTEKQTEKPSVRKRTAKKAE